eukprot:scaffold8721_cov80-Phaeocystis_antarctica.AAC.38
MPSGSHCGSLIASSLSSLSSLSVTTVPMYRHTQRPRSISSAAKTPMPFAPVSFIRHAGSESPRSGCAAAGAKRAP